jgi:hypothetical protein
LSNIYENFIDVLGLFDICDLSDIYLDYCEDTEKTIGIISDIDFIYYIMEEALKKDWVSVQKIDIDFWNDDDSQYKSEYMLSLNPDGNMIIQPVTYYDDQHFRNMDRVYISMEGDVSQTTIDACLEMDMEVYLFGYVTD